MNFFVEPLAFEFMRQALYAVVIISIPCGLLSCYLVLKGWALMGDAVAHSVLPGVVIAYIIGIPLLIGAFVAGLFSALASGYLTQNCRVKQDTIMGVVFSGMFGFGLVLYTSIESEVHLDHILFGDILGIEKIDFWQTLAISLCVTFIVLLRRKDLLMQAFDPNHCAAVGLPVNILHYGLLSLLSLTIVATLKVAGLILAIAFLIAPGATAFLIVRRFTPMMIVAISIAVFSSVLGVIVSFHLDSAPAPTIVVFMTVFFISALLFAPGRGILFNRFAE